MTVQRTLKKTKLNLDRKKFHKTTPESHAAFVAAMEDVLGVYLYSRPVVPMDESDRRLAAEARAPTRPGKGAG
jgi:hypothetical protein